MVADPDLGRLARRHLGRPGTVAYQTTRPVIPVPKRDVILATTYVVVVFSILVQGLTVGPMTRRWVRRASAAAAPLKGKEGEHG